MRDKASMSRWIPFSRMRLATFVDVDTTIVLWFGLSSEDDGGIQRPQRRHETLEPVFIRRYRVRGNDRDEETPRLGTRALSECPNMKSSDHKGMMPAPRVSAMSRV